MGTASSQDAYLALDAQIQAINAAIKKNQAAQKANNARLAVLAKEDKVYNDA